MTHIVKRKGHKQEFDERKIYASVYAASLSAHADKEEAEAVANLVSREIKKWIEGKVEVNSDEIFKKVSEELMSLNKDAAFMYTTHRDVS
ncbi:hypothetical protein HYS94_05685 [Candidatus Daviesbacteria bacterium]|nr:hypothetical protein [Candidatus Daviesbacteria bacterium]